MNDRYQKFAEPGDTVIEPDDRRLAYCGRIGKDADGKPVFVFPCTYVKWRFRGSGAAAVVSNQRYYYDVFAGYTIDGADKPECVRLPENETSRVVLCSGLEDGEHEICFYKRQDACNTITIHAILLENNGELLDCTEEFAINMEVYGDSVSAGEVSEAVECTGQPDPEGHEGKYSNSWYSYSWMTARKLNARLHDIAQGGVALLPHTGWFSAPEYVGMEQIYDKILYYPDLGNAAKWDFSRYIPDVCIVALGQNDANPENYMKNDYEGEKACMWRRHYAEFLRKLRKHYPKALIICSTTILMHDGSWDRAIGEVVENMHDAKIRHFLYSNNGTGTPGHIRIPEAEKMASELAEYISTFEIRGDK